MRVAVICAIFLAITVTVIEAESGRRRKMVRGDRGELRSRERKAPRRRIGAEKTSQGETGRKGKQMIRGRKLEGRASIVVKGNDCEFIYLADITSNSGCSNGQKFVLKGANNTRKQFLIVNDKAIIAFITKRKKFTACESFTDITTSVSCKSVSGLDNITLPSSSSNSSSNSTGTATTASGGAANTTAAAASNATTTAAPASNTTAAPAASNTTAAASNATSASNSSGSRKVNLTHSAHGAFGYAELISDTSVMLTELYYDGAGPKTNWIVGTKSSIGVDSNTVIIDKLTESGEALYSDASDLSDAVPSLPAYQNASTTLSLPIKDGKQMTWSDVSWLALYCRKVSMLFMSVNIPSDFESSR